MKQYVAPSKQDIASDVYQRIWSQLDEELAIKTINISGEIAYAQKALEEQRMNSGGLSFFEARYGGLPKTLQEMIAENIALAERDRIRIDNRFALDFFFRSR